MSTTKSNNDHPSHIQEITIAGGWVRLMGVLYDGMLVLAVLFLAGLILVSVGTVLFGVVGNSAGDAVQLPGWYRHFVLSPSFVLTLFGFYGIFWTKSGQTLGMQTWRLKTIAANGYLLTWHQSLKRIICACFLPCFGAMAAAFLGQTVMGVGLAGFAGLIANYAVCWLHPRGLALHDWLSGTLTVRIQKFEHQGLFR